MGVASATAPSGVASQATGNLSGTLYWAVSYQLDGYQEGSIGPSSTGVVCTASQCTLTIPTSTNTRCTGRYIYRTKSNTTTMYRMATIANNSITTYVDNIADSSLDTLITSPIDYGAPSSYRYGCLHKERVYLAWNKTYNSMVIFSDIRNGISYPDVFPSQNYLNIARDDGDEITFIKNDHINQLIVAKKNSIRIINTTTNAPETWGITEPFSNQGCIAPYSAAVTPIGIIYLTRYGENKKRLVLWTGSEVRIISELEGIVNILSDIPETMLELVRGHYHNGFNYLAYRDPIAGGSFNNRVMVIDIFRNWATAIDKKNIASFCSWNGGNDFGELYSATADGTGTIHREDVNSYDFMIRYLSELNQGTNSFTQTSGTENYPSLGLLGTVSGAGGQTWSTATIWSNYTGAFDTWWLNGEWVDTVREISAKILSGLVWNKVETGNTVVVLYIRVGDTIAECQTAAWNGPYLSNSGSDISSVTAKKYIQIKAKLFTKYVGNYNEVYMTRDGTEDYNYVIKLSTNSGTPEETTIEFDWQSGRIDLGDMNEVYKRLRKRLRSVKIEYERDSTAVGAFDFMWYNDSATSPTGQFNHSYSTSELDVIYNFPLDKSYFMDFIYRIYSNYDVGDLEIKRIIFTISTEPYYVKR
jgi:hypothetical protein